MKLVKHPDPRLRQACAAFTADDLDAIRAGAPIHRDGNTMLNSKQLLDELLQVCRKWGGIGLAGPQVGIMRRLICINLSGVHALILNPEIVYSRGKQSRREGCLSYPGRTVFIERAHQVRVAGFDHTGQAVEHSGRKLLATVFQHEIDHLDGVCRVAPVTPGGNS